MVAEPRRRAILRLIWSSERTAGDIAGAFDLTFGAVSQHLAVLREAGFVSVRKDGNRRWYLADHRGLGDLAPMLEHMWSESLDRLVETISQAEKEKRERRPR